MNNILAKIRGLIRFDMKLIKTLFLASSFILLTACGMSNKLSSPQPEFEDHLKTPLEGKFKTEYLGEDARGWILYDNETGCQYIAMSAQGSYTPRLNAEGKPMCKSTK